MKNKSIIHQKVEEAAQQRLELRQARHGLLHDRVRHDIRYRVPDHALLRFARWSVMETRSPRLATRGKAELH